MCSRIQVSIRSPILVPRTQRNALQSFVLLTTSFGFVFAPWETSDLPKPTCTVMSSVMIWSLCSTYVYRILLGSASAFTTLNVLRFSWTTGTISPTWTPKLRIYSPYLKKSHHIDSSTPLATPVPIYQPIMISRTKCLPVCVDYTPCQERLINLMFDRFLIS